jgi:sigma-B regulation protein RsbU (phosphoserine phosphatase)
MTFQYFSLNGKTGDAIYANAGGWSPLFFEKETGKIQEITLTALVLGAFKKVNYTEINFSFKPGDALILYTDGIIECQNFSGEMFGFTNFKELVTNSYDPDPQKFYKKILHGYNQHLEGRAAQDDLTIIVLVFNQGAN